MECLHSVEINTLNTIPHFIVDHRLPNCRLPRIQENTDMNGRVQVKFHSREKRLLFNGYMEKQDMAVDTGKNRHVATNITMIGASLIASTFLVCHNN